MTAAVAAAEVEAEASRAADGTDGRRLRSDAAHARARRSIAVQPCNAASRRRTVEPSANSLPKRSSRLGGHFEPQSTVHTREQGKTLVRRNHNDNSEQQNDQMRNIDPIFIQKYLSIISEASAQHCPFTIAHGKYHSISTRQ